MSDTVLKEIKDGAAYITINREKALNALNKEVLESLGRVLDEIKEHSEVRVLFIKGAGDKAFVAGADIAEMKDFNSVEATEFAKLGHSVLNKIGDLSVPAVALVDGFALGGGFELALSCDFILATEKSRFGLPEVSLGLIPGFGGTQRLSRSIGLSLAKALTLTGEMVAADFLENKNVVYKVLQSKDELLLEAEKLTKTLMLKGPLAVKVAKSAVQEGFSSSLSEGLELEKQEFALLFGTKETVEGLNAFLEKRKPKF